jgi:hypothetical protein
VNVRQHSLSDAVTARPLGQAAAMSRLAKKANSRCDATRRLADLPAEGVTGCVEGTAQGLRMQPRIKWSCCAALNGCARRGGGC